jgi:hypothetical protein
MDGLNGEAAFDVEVRSVPATCETTAGALQADTKTNTIRRLRYC